MTYLVAHIFLPSIFIFLACCCQQREWVWVCVSFSHFFRSEFSLTHSLTHSVAQLLSSLTRITGSGSSVVTSPCPHRPILLLVPSFSLPHVQRFLCIRHWSTVARRLSATGNKSFCPHLPFMFTRSVKKATSLYIKYKTYPSSFRLLILRIRTLISTC
jgi:hypothetical protein